MPNTVPVHIAPGELIDKITILEIKKERISDPVKLRNVAHEWDVLTAARDAHTKASAALDALSAELRQINEKLWEIEDDIRLCERDEDFGPTFVELARAVYVTNDQRARVKKEINELLGSSIIEEKSYEDY